MRTVFFIFFIFISCSAISQPTDSALYLKAVHWAIRLPQGYSMVSAEVNAKMTAAGAKTMKDATNTSLDTFGLVYLFNCSFSQFDFFYSTFQKLRPGEHYRLALQTTCEALYGTFAARYPTLKIDSSSAVTKIAGRDFDRFTVAINAKTVFHMVVLSEFYKGADFGIVYTYTDDEAKKLVEAALAASRFDDWP